jgi:predicted nucleic acid-binding protein
MVIVDTGVLYALADRRDTHHKTCVRWLAATPRPLIVPRRFSTRSDPARHCHLVTSCRTT